MRTNIFKMSYSANNVTYKSTTEEWSEWGQRNVEYTTENVVREGTRITIEEMEVGQDYLDKYTEVRKFTFPEGFNLVFKTELKDSFEAFLTLKKDGRTLSTIVKDNDLEEKTLYFQVHHGIQGWYITTLSHSTIVDVYPHPRFDTYGFKEAILRGVERGMAEYAPKYENGERGDAQDMIEKLLGTPPDSRYAV